MKYPQIEGYTFEPEEALTGAFKGLYFRLQPVGDGEPHYGVAVFSRPTGAAKSIYGVRCDVTAVDKTGAVVVRRGPVAEWAVNPITFERTPVPPKALAVSATAAAAKAADPARAAAQAVELAETALDRAVRELLREIGVEAANAEVGIG